MLKLFDYRNLILIALVLGLAPFHPMPHLLEKLIMLRNGTLSRPIDIFDLFMHGTPVVILIVKAGYDLRKKYLKQSTSL